MTDCDKAASNPDDPYKLAPGVPLKQVNPLASLTCGLAAGFNTGEPRFRYLLGRINVAAGNATEAANQFRAAVKGGYPMAKYDLGVLTLYGKGVSKDLAQGRRLILEAAADNVPVAQRDAGVLLEKGIGGPKDIDGARSYYQKAANAGLRRAAELLAALNTAHPQAQPKPKPDPTPQVSEMLKTKPAEPAKSPKPPKKADSKPSRALVKRVQEGLNVLGYDTGVPDGLAGKRTRTAIAAFQKDAGLPQSGNVSDALDKAIQTALANTEDNDLRTETFTVGKPPAGLDALADELVAAIEGDQQGAAFSTTDELLTKKDGEAAQGSGGSRASVTPDPKPAANASPTSDSGPSKNLVITIQALLGRLGYEAGPPTGELTDKTKSAIIAYQAVEGLIPDGQPTDELRDHLIASVQR